MSFLFLIFGQVYIRLKWAALWKLGATCVKDVIFNSLFSLYISYLIHLQILFTSALDYYSASLPPPSPKPPLFLTWVIGVHAQSLQLCPTLSDPMDCSPPGSSVHGISQARKLEWVARPFSRGSSLPRDWTRISCTAGIFLAGQMIIFKRCGWIDHWQHQGLCIIQCWVLTVWKK